MAMRHKKGQYSFNKEKAIDPSDHPHSQPQMLLSFTVVLIVMTVGVIVKSEDLQRRQRGRKRIRHLLHSRPECGQDGAVALYLWYEVQESVSWQSSHRKAHKQLQDECVGFLAGVEEDQADTKHGAHRDEQDSSRAVAILCR